MGVCCGGVGLRGGLWLAVDAGGACGRLAQVLGLIEGKF